MFAVIKTGGKQYSVESGKTLKIEKIDGKKGDNCIFKDVLIIADASKQTLGTPIIEGASVEATIVEQIRDKKIIVFKKKRRKNYRRTKGHRQYLTVLKINKIINKSSIKTSKLSTNSDTKDKKAANISKAPEKAKVTKKKLVSKKKIIKKTGNKKDVKKKLKKDK